MKKVLMFLCMFVLLSMCIGCGSVANPENYTKDKEVEVTKEVTLDEAKAEVTKVEEDDSTKYVTVDMTMKVQGYTTTGTIQMSQNGNLINGKTEVTTAMSMASTTVTIYIKDSFLYYDTGVAGKYKVEIPADENYNYEEASDLDFSGVIDTLNFEGEGVKLGYDSKGCLIMEIKNDSVFFRLVIDGKKPVYYAFTSATTSFEYKFNYDKFTIEYPEDLETNATEISWDKFTSMYE